MKRTAPKSSEMDIAKGVSEMSESRYPLCEAAGLKVSNPHDHAELGYVAAYDVERLLSEAPLMNCVMLGESNLIDEHGPGWDACQDTTRMNQNATHTARLVCIQPTVRESEERQLLRALVTSDISTREGYSKYHAAYDRAKALLEEK